MDENEAVDSADLALFRAHLADPIAIPFSSAVKRKCNVVGALRACDIPVLSLFTKAASVTDGIIS